MILTSYNEEQLYYACMNFCKHFFRYMCKRNEYHNALRLGADFEEREAMMRQEQKPLQHAFEKLQEAIKIVGEE